MTTMTTEDKRYSSEDPMALGDEVFDVESYRVGRRRGLGEALDAAAFMGFSRGKQGANYVHEQPEHDLEAVYAILLQNDDPLKFMAPRTHVYAQQKPVQLLTCKRCGAICSEMSGFDDIACTEEEDEGDNAEGEAEEHCPYCYEGAKAGADAGGETE